MSKILVAYITNCGTTRDVAEAVAEEINKTGFETEVKPLMEVETTEAYAGVVLGAPMIIGWHKNALQYLKQHKQELAKKPLALFLMGMSLTEWPLAQPLTFDLKVDSRLSVPPQKNGRLSFKEKFTTLQHYIEPVLKTAPESLSAAAFFGGRLDFRRLKWWEVAFVMLVIGAKPGEKRNYAEIRAWAASLPTLMKIEKA